MAQAIGPLLSDVQRSDRFEFTTSAELNPAGVLPSGNQWVLAEGHRIAEVPFQIEIRQPGRTFASRFQIPGMDDAETVGGQYRIIADELDFLITPEFRDFCGNRQLDRSIRRRDDANRIIKMRTEGERRTVRRAGELFNQFRRSGSVEHPAFAEIPLRPRRNHTGIGTGQVLGILAGDEKPVARPRKSGRETSHDLGVEFGYDRTGLLLGGREGTGGRKGDGGEDDSTAK
jgi:hypothetical protein